MLLLHAFCRESQLKRDTTTGKRLSGIRKLWNTNKLVVKVDNHSLDFVHGSTVLLVGCNMCHDIHISTYHYYWSKSISLKHDAWERRSSLKIHVISSNLRTPAFDLHQRIIISLLNSLYWEPSEFASSGWVRNPLTWKDSQQVLFILNATRMIVFFNENNLLSSEMDALQILRRTQNLCPSVYVGL